MVIKKVFDNKIFENIVALFSVNVIGYIVSFISFPYLTHVLGVERFGSIALAQGISNYFLMIITYGFNLTGPKEIATGKSNQEIARRFSAIICAKGVLFIFVSIIYIIGIYIFPYFHEDRYIFLSVSLSFVGEWLFPLWFFQGIERMRYITFATLFSKTMVVVTIFALVRESADAWIAALLLSSTSLVSTVFALYIIYKNYKYVFVKVSWDDVLMELKEGKKIFLSILSTNLYTGSNIVILGFMTNTTIVGYFSAAQKIFLAVKMMIDNIFVAVYPRVNRLFMESNEKAISFLKITLRRVGILAFVMVLILSVISEKIIPLFLGLDFLESIIIFRILIWIPFVVVFTNIFLLQVLIPLGYQKDYSTIVFLSALFNLIIIWPLIYFLNGVGVAIAMLITEIFVAISSIRCSHKKRIYLSRFI